VLRKLKEMVGENILDFTVEGKNKVYFLRKSIEGRNAVLAAELYKQSRLVMKYPLLRGIIRAVVDMHDIRLALIFGSYAKGTAHDRSDIDLFIETEDRTLKKKLEGQYPALNVKIGRFDQNSPLVREMLNDHIIIRGVEEYYEKTRFFA
jgi:predicted nucleotidyltransferase